MHVEPLANIPTNLVMGFLGVGKTTTIINLVAQKPAYEQWAVLVNEFGKTGIDGTIFADSGATVKQIPGGCLCCAVGLPFQVGVNQLIKQVRPDRLLIEPSGLGHPKQVLDMLTKGNFKDLLDIRASLCLIDPEKLKHPRYTNHQSYIDQIALSDVLVANKTDLADSKAMQLFDQIAEQSAPEKARIERISHGNLTTDWMDISRNPDRCAVFPNAHSTLISSEAQNPAIHEINEFKSISLSFSADCCFHHQQLIDRISSLDLERLKGLLLTDKGWHSINCIDGVVDTRDCSTSHSSCIDIIVNTDQMADFRSIFDQCIIR